MSKYVEAQKDYSDWLSSLKVGDRVLVSIGRKAPTHYDTKVIRSTMTLLFTEDGTKYRRSDGKQSPESRYCTTRLIEPTQERIDAQRKKDLASTFRNELDWSGLDLGTLESVSALVASHTKNPKD